MPPNFLWNGEGWIYCQPKICEKNKKQSAALAVTLNVMSGKGQLLFCLETSFVKMSIHKAPIAAH